MSQTSVRLMDIGRAETFSEAYCREYFPVRYEKALRFRSDEDRLRCISAGILLHEVLKLKENEIRFNRYGKPFTDSGACFSLTHSGKYAALAVNTVTIGVDLEETGRKYYPAIMPRVFTDEEIRFAGDDRIRFFLLWTWKEALAKAVGTGLAMPFKEISVLPFLEKAPVIWEGKSWYGSGMSIDDGQYVLSCAAETKEAAEIFRY